MLNRLGPLGLGLVGGGVGQGGLPRRSQSCIRTGRHSAAHSWGVVGVASSVGVGSSPFLSSEQALKQHKVPINIMQKNTWCRTEHSPELN